MFSKKNNRRFMFLIILCAVLVGIFSIKKAVQYYEKKYSSHQAFPKFNQKTISDILIRNNDRQFNIYKNNGQWKIRENGFEYTADTDKINAIIDAYMTLQKGDVVSNNINNRNEFGIGNQKITLKTKSQSYVLYVGKNASADTVYVSTGENGSVFITAGLSDLFSSADYRDLNPHLITDENNVTRVQIQYQDHGLVLDKKNSDWYIDQQKLIRERVDFFLNDIKTLKASDMSPISNVASSLSSVSFSLQIKENNKDIQVAMYQKDKDTFYVKASNSDFVYEIPNVYISSLEKEEKDFIN